MPKEKRKVEDIDESESSYEGNPWFFGIEWLLVLALLVVALLAIAWILSPILVGDPL